MGKNNPNYDDDFADLWADLIREGFASDEWKVRKQYDGCTLVQDKFHPCPACFVHDYMCQTGRGGVMCDRIFKHCMINEGMKRWRVGIRWFAVRAYFVIYSYWKHVSKRNLKQPTEAMKRINSYIVKK